MSQARDVNTKARQTVGERFRRFVAVVWCVAVCGFILWAVGWLLILQPIGGTKSIHEAAQRGDLAEVQYQVEHGTPVDLTGPHYRTPLYLALENGHTEVARFLLDAGASPKGLLQLAVKSKDVDLVRRMVDRGETVPANGLVAALVIGQLSSDNLEIADYLLQCGSQIDATLSRPELGLPPSLSDYTALHAAVWHRDVGMVEYLVRNGANVNARTSRGQTALDVAETSRRVYTSGDGTGTGPGVHFYNVIRPSPQIVSILRGEEAQ